MKAPARRWGHSEDMHTNRLASEQSPYLLQHAHNPVDWFPWGRTPSKKPAAKTNPSSFPSAIDVPLVPRHGARVFRRPSYRRAIEPRLRLHQGDREERPDVMLYMTFVQATTGGGCPCRSGSLPICSLLGGTYFPPEARYGHPGFASILTQIAAAWAPIRDQIADSARTSWKTFANTCVERRAGPSIMRFSTAAFLPSAASRRAPGRLRRCAQFRALGLQLPAALLGAHENRKLSTWRL